MRKTLIKVVTIKCKECDKVIRGKDRNFATAAFAHHYLVEHTKKKGENNGSIANSN